MPAVPLTGPISTSSWRAVSNACSGGADADCGSEGAGRELQACMASPYPGYESADGSERRPWDRWPFAAWPRQPASTEQQVCAVDHGCDLSIAEQRTELFGRLV